MEIRTSENLDKLSPAMLAAQQAMENAEIDSDNPHFRSRYASLSSVLLACKKPLNEAGIFFIQAPVALDCKDCLGLVTRLTHAASGQWLEATMSMPLQKVDPQGMGSAITYARRYALMAILGIAAEEDDDDAEAAMQRPSPQYQERRPEPQRQAAQPGRGLPNLPGISFVDGNINGQAAIVADGRGIYNNREALKQFGFRFDQNSKKWWLPNGNRYQEPALEYDEVPFN